MIPPFITLAEKFEEEFSFLRDFINKANINKTLVEYLSMTFFFTFVSFIASLIASIFLVPIFFKGFLQILLMFFSPILTSISVFLMMLYYPINKASSRRVNIENLLPFSIVHLASITRSGIPVYFSFKILSGFKEYGEVGKEFERVIRNMENFGMNFVVALRDVAKKTPSERMRELLNGLASTIISGGDVRSYLSYLAERVMIEWKGRRERYIHRLTTIAEIYIGVVLSSPLFLISLLAIMGMVSPKIGGFTIVQIAWLGVYVLLPAINLIFLVFLKLTEVEI